MDETQPEKKGNLYKLIKFFGYDNKRRFFWNIVFDVIIILAFSAMTYYSVNYCTCIEPAVNYLTYVQQNFSVYPTLNTSNISAVVMP